MNRQLTAVALPRLLGSGCRRPERAIARLIGVGRSGAPGRGIKLSFSRIALSGNHAVARGWPALGFTANLSPTDRPADCRGKGLLAGRRTGVHAQSALGCVLFRRSKATFGHSGVQ